MPLEVGCGNRPPCSSSRRAEPGGRRPGGAQRRPTADRTVGAGIHKAPAAFPRVVEGGCGAGSGPKPRPKECPDPSFGRRVQCQLKPLRPAEFAGHVGARQLPAGPCHEQELDPVESALEPHLPPSAWARGDRQGLLDIEGPPQEAAVVKGFFQLSF